MTSTRIRHGCAVGATAALVLVAALGVMHASQSVTGQGQSVTATAGKVVVIRTTGVELSYSVTTIRAKAGETITVRYDATASEMAHNIVLVRGEADIQPVGVAALAAHGTDYIPAGERDRIVSHSVLAYPGETIEWTFVVPPPGTYPYICTFSGHFTMMQGRLISTD